MVSALQTSNYHYSPSHHSHHNHHPGTKPLGSSRESILNGGGGCSSSVATLQPHPFNVLISDYQQKRNIPSLKKQANINDFMVAFQSEMKELDQ